MKLLSEDDSETRALRWRVRGFLFSALIVGGASLIAVAARQGVFTHTIPIHFFAESAQDISKGMAVKVVGFKIGKVEQISIEADNRIKVEIAINDDYTRLIPRDSVAKVTKEGLIGASMVEIHPGQDKRRTVAPNDVLLFERESGLIDLAQRLTDKLDPILQDVRQITASINDPSGEIRQAVSHMGATTQALRTSSDELVKLVQQGGKSAGVLGEQVSSVLTRTDQSMALAQKALGTVDQALPDLLKKLDGTMENVQKISQEGAQQLPALLRDGRAAAGDTHDIVSGAKKIWPIRGMLDPAPSNSLPLDSYVPLHESPR